MFLFHKPILMQSTNQLLTKRELKYATRRFKNNQFTVRGLWPAYLVITLVGVIIISIEDETFWIGIALILFGIIGAIFFRRFSKQTTFEIQRTVEIHIGKLNKRLFTSLDGQYHRFFLDDYLMEIPDALESILFDLVEKYKDQKISVQFVVCKQKKDGKVYSHYTPLKIENEICIYSAVKNYGPQFLRKATFRLYFEFMMFILLIGVLSVTISIVFEFFDLENPVLFLILLLSGTYFGYRMYTKFIPTKDINLKEKITCTC